MPNDALLWNAPPPPPRKPKPTEHLWSMRKGSDQAAFVLLCHGEYGWEWQVRSGGFLYGRRCTLRADAIAYAAEERRDREKRGWTMVEEDSSKEKQ
jgi:hypothetical protein